MNKLVIILWLGIALSVISCKEKCTLDCQNGATCDQASVSYGGKNPGYECNCAAGFEGTSCQTRITNRFWGIYAFASGDNCITSADTLSNTVVKFDETSGIKFMIGNIVADYKSKTSTATFTEYSFDIAAQQNVAIGSSTLDITSGTGKFKFTEAESVKDTLILNLNFANNLSCSGKYVK